MKRSLAYIALCCLLVVSCTTDQDDNIDGYTATPLELNIPPLFAEKILPPVIPEDNPQSVEGVALGRKLFFEKKLSADNTLACAGCHSPASAFSDPRQFSVGIDGLAGTRNSMPLFNLAWNYNELFFWDGRAVSVEDQALFPVVDPIEMHNTWPDAVNTLQEDPEYPALFEAAFGTQNIDSVLVTKAIAQFVRTLISGDSKFDRYLAGTEQLTQSELNGLNIFLDENRGDCFHCHGNPNNPLWTDNIFHNNGLDETHTDRGRGEVTGDPREFGTFKTPSLRNLAYTAPYMHDGRFNTIDEVIDHYSEGLVYSETIDPLMKKVDEGGVGLTPEEKADLKAFLLSLSDPGFISNPDFQDPN
jgi:cytochrome c peroxidase